jgi:hypothetical protein
LGDAVAACTSISSACDLRVNDLSFCLCALINVQRIILMQPDPIEEQLKNFKDDLLKLTPEEVFPKHILFGECAMCQVFSDSFVKKIQVDLAD